jgi:16S rRNA (uracil1498-N3)-methyltransferase
MLVPDGGTTLPELLADPAAHSIPIRLLVGPEGGLDAAEISAAVQCGFRACRLGPRVLRTETAGLAALAALQSLTGDLR